MRRGRFAGPLVAVDVASGEEERDGHVHGRQYNTGEQKLMQVGHLFERGQKQHDQKQESRGGGGAGAIRRWPVAGLHLQKIIG
jgi:hypothetical protein